MRCGVGDVTQEVCCWVQFGMQRPTKKTEMESSPTLLWSSLPLKGELLRAFGFRAGVQGYGLGARLRGEGCGLMTGSGTLGWEQRPDGLTAEGRALACFWCP